MFCIVLYVCLLNNNKTQYKIKLIKMDSKDTRIELKERIQKKLQRGDVVAIAKTTGYSEVYVSRVLNPDIKDVFNDSIIDEAVKIIEEREVKRQGNLERLGQ